MIYTDVSKLTDKELIECLDMHKNKAYSRLSGLTVNKIEEIQMELHRRGYKVWNGNVTKRDGP
jgi:hypothetical protein